MSDAKSTDKLVESGHNVPSYTDKENGSPPNYNSIMDEIRQAKKDSSHGCQFLKNLCIILTNTIVFAILLGIFVVIPIAMIVVGALNLHNCKAQPFIPIWLLVTGFVVTFVLIISIIDRSTKLYQKRNSRENEYNRTLQQTYVIFTGILMCFVFVWFITGSVWVYSIFHPSSNPVHNSYCNGGAYWLAFTVLTAGYIFIIFSCLCSCAIVLAFSC